MALVQPLLGFGPGTFPDVYPAYQPASFWLAFVPAAHNEYLQTAVECGLPALLLLLLFLWAVLRETGSRLLKTTAFEEVPRELMISEFVFFLVLLEGIHNLVDFTFHEWCHRLVILGFVTMALSQKKLGDDVKVFLEFSRRAFMAGFLILFVFIFWTLGVGSLRDYFAKAYNFKATLAYEQQDLDSAEDFSRKSLDLRQDLMESWDLLGAIEDVRGERSSKPHEKRKFFDAAEQFYEKAAQLSPYSRIPVENRVRLMMVQGRLEDALDLQNDLIQRAPQYPPSYINQGKILLALGHAQEAIASAQKAIDLDYAFIPSYLLKEKAMEAIGKKKDAIQVYRSIEEILKKINNPDLQDRLNQIESAIQKLQK
jgi:tetratricopeptide (TPR) repeat protein